jgi:hypothetical protein
MEALSVHGRASPTDYSSLDRATGGRPHKGGPTSCLSSPTRARHPTGLLPVPRMPSHCSLVPIRAWLVNR